MSLRNKTLSAVKWNLLATLITTSLGIILLWALSHLLTTQQYGVVSAALIVSTFCMMLIDFGISNSIIRSRSLLADELSSLYVVNVVLGIIICAVILLLSSQITALFKADEMLTSQIRLMALGFIILSFGLQPRALLTREMQFRPLAQVNIATTLTNFVVAISLALIYHTSWCIALAFLVSSLVNAVASRWAARPLMHYRFRFRIAPVKNHLHYGIQLVMDSLINQISINTYPVLMSRLISITAIGGYSIAYSISIALFEKLNPVLSHALFPAFAQIGHNQLRLKETFLKVTTFSALINFPLLTGMLLIADPLVNVFFAGKWHFIIPVIQLLCIVGAVRSIDTAVIAVLLVRAKMYLNVRFGIVKLLFGIPLTWFMGTTFGLLGIVYSFLIIQVVNTSLGYFLLLRPCIGKTGSAYFRAISVPVLHVMPMLVICSLISQQASALRHSELLALTVLSGVMVYTLTILLSPCQTVREFRQVAIQALMIKRVVT
ncbi:MOP flippase family protein [Erwiniaceae bacterium BAC15a-03b]|uniref:MOP flippase family protein n=1 Tax=Winslowiella arboricola TaxID=2978220 RepID=A0A9J6PR16_9GAMM|nr:MOP flippase family protein [Winslowiella arboricola]MCU5774542.1 MOP flippase family protein [Winslowiella arboricola]MCU5778048.1 MOP flippase family protein [Winslowiella arboricola]